MSTSSDVYYQEFVVHPSLHVTGMSSGGGLALLVSRRHHFQEFHWNVMKNNAMSMSKKVRTLFYKLGELMADMFYAGSLQRQRTSMSRAIFNYPKVFPTSTLLHMTPYEVRSTTLRAHYALATPTFSSSPYTL